MSRKEPIINAIADTKKQELTLFFHQNCKLDIKVGFDNEASSVSITMSESTAKETLLVLHSLYGMEDWEVCSRLTKEQFKFIEKLANDREMTNEDVVRELIQRQMNLS